MIPISVLAVVLTFEENTVVKDFVVQPGSNYNF